MLKAGVRSKIEYTKKDETTTERVIIPINISVAVNIPETCVESVDVSSLTEIEQSELEQLAQEYLEYVKLQQSRIFNFDDWLDHKNITRPALKWRRFKVANIKEL